MNERTLYKQEDVRTPEPCCCCAWWWLVGEVVMVWYIMW